MKRHAPAVERNREPLLTLYGPSFAEGRPTAPSNLAFDESLPSNNLTAVFRLPVSP